MPANESRGPLAGLRVLDLADEKGAYCGKLFADMGADVIKIEPPGGDRTRSFGPFVDDVPHPERSLYFFQYNTNKRSVTLDLGQDSGRDAFRRLAAAADVVVETFPPGYLDSIGLGFDELRGMNPGLIVTSITGFGQTGPYSRYKSSDLIATAMGGMMYVCGHPETPPVRPYGGQAYHTGSQYGAIGTLIALHNRAVTGLGQHVDVSLQESISSIIEHSNVFYIYSKVIARRQGTRHGLRGPGITQDVHPTKDGYVYLTPGGEWDVLVNWLAGHGCAADLGDDKWQDMMARRVGEEHVYEVLADFSRQFPKDQLFHEAQKRHLTWASVNTPEDLVNHVQLNARGFFVELEHPELGRTLKYPGAPYKFSLTPWQLRRRAPLIGEHNREVLGDELGLSNGAPIAAGPPPSRGMGTRQPSAVASAAQAVVSGPSATRNGMALSGIRVADFTWAMAGPFATKMLGDFGAEVIRMELREGRDLSRRLPPFPPGKVGPNYSGYFNNLNRNKQSVILNLNHPKGIEVAKQIIKLSDIVVENFSGGTMKRWGLDYDSLVKIKPDIVMISMAGLGQSGPLKDYHSYGPTLQALSCHTDLTGFPDHGPAGIGYSYLDHIGGITGALAALQALWYKRQTGKGQYVDLAQFEAGAVLLETAILDYTVNGRVHRRMGNRLVHTQAAPHGAYRCLGEDRWCVIAVFTDEEWKALCRAIGEPAWCKEERFATLSRRMENLDDLDALVESWTCERSAEDVMDLLQKEGVPAGVVQNARDLIESDPQLRERGFYPELTHPLLGQAKFEGLPIKLSDTPGSVRRHGPLVGEDNDYIYTHLLGMAEEEINQYMVEGVF